MNQDKLTEANAAFKLADYPKADKLFAQAENGELTKKQFADVALARGEIAEQGLRWEDAAGYYAKATALNPCFETLIRAQRLALYMADYDFALSLGESVQKEIINENKENSQEHATILNNLGGVYKRTGQLEKAESLYKESLDIQKKLLIKDDPMLAGILNNLAGIYNLQGQYEKAKPLYEEALTMDTKIFGKDHPETATDMNNLGAVYEFQGDYGEAESYYRQALNIREKKQAKNHPNIANSLNSLAVLYQKWNKTNEAGPLYVRAINILESNFGSEHPDTKLVQGNYERFINVSAQVANSAGPPSA